MNREKVIVSIGLSLIIFFLFLIPFIKDINQERRLDKEGVYTVGEILNIVDDHHASPSVKYRFNYENKPYEDFSSISKFDKALISQRYFVIVLPDAPSMTRMLLDKPVPKRIKGAPSAGWKTLPE